MSPVAGQWDLAVTAAAALAVDPEGLGGAVIRARPGPARDRWMTLLTTILTRSVRRLPGSVDASALSAQLDLGATVRSGRRVERSGILGESSGSVIVVPMAERLGPGVAAQLAIGLDRQDAPSLVLLDESVEPDEAVPDGLSDRLAIQLSLDGLALGDLTDAAPGPDQVRAAAMRLAEGVDDGDALVVLTQLAGSMGIGSLRAPILALRLARALTALDGVHRIGTDHLTQATALCLAPRALVLPSPNDEADAPEPPPPEPKQDPEDGARSEAQSDGPLEDQVLEAVQALLPELAIASAARNRGASSATGAGEKQQSAQSGRPIRSRPGRPQAQRLDVFATLSAAAPWQSLRRKEKGDKRLIILPEDFRIKQYDRPAESVLIFLVDASGSQAASRMAEAKGAVELMLAEAYRRREKVALLAFRGTGAELLLPPTRSLLQAKRRLAVLPGGGPTPLASALVAGREIARQTTRRGATPYLILLTDGRGNIGLSGQPGRAEAAEDQRRAALALQADGISCVLIDTANRPQPDAKTLAIAMAAQYLPLPRADARGISRIVRAGQPG